MWETTKKQKQTKVASTHSKVCAQNCENIFGVYSFSSKISFMGFENFLSVCLFNPSFGLDTEKIEGFNASVEPRLDIRCDNDEIGSTPPFHFFS